MSERERLLGELKSECQRGDTTRILTTLEALLAWLASADHNTDENCRAVDRFVLLEVLDEVNAAIPSGLRELLWDIGCQLHDTHTSPALARNFDSTPEQLLARTRALRASPPG